MVQNIAITGFNREKLKSVGKALAEMLEMYYVDTIELYEFDHIPHTMTDMLKAQGRKEFRHKEIGTIGYVTDFSNAVITFETGAIKSAKNVKTLKSTCELVYLYEDVLDVKAKLDSDKYASGELKKFFNIPLNSIKLRSEKLIKISDVVVEIDRKTPKMIAGEILAKMQQKYC